MLYIGIIRHTIPNGVTHIALYLKGFIWVNPPLLILLSIFKVIILLY